MEKEGKKVLVFRAVSGILSGFQLQAVL